jgi:curved DNA-binding protein CbpA
MSKTKKFVVEKGYYEILEVTPACTTIELDRAFSRLFQEHVNINSEDESVRKKSAEILFNIAKAYEVLSDPFQRLNYDQRRFNGKLPFNNEVETIFKEGIKNYRQNKLDNAIHFLKEAVYLHPHKVVYRVNLAIAYFEKGLIQEATKQLRMSLKLEPDNRFAKEIVARLLFGVSDKKTLSFLSNKINRQIIIILSTLFLVGIISFFALPKIIKYIENSKNFKMKEEISYKIQEIKSQLPSDFKQAVEKNKAQVKKVNKILNINKLPDEFKLEGKVYDYTNLKPIKKNYYSSQNMVVITYDDGTVTSYKVEDVIGWKYDLNNKLPVIITKSNEIIPVPGDLEVTLENGNKVLPGDKDFPSWAFPNTLTLYNYSNIQEKNNSMYREEKKESKNLNDNIPKIGLPPN